MSDRDYQVRIAAQLTTIRAQGEEIDALKARIEELQMMVDLLTPALASTTNTRDAGPTAFGGRVTDRIRL